MSTSDTRSANGGLTFVGALTLLFIALKLTHYIPWSWWWVLSPIWIGAAITLCVLILVFVAAFVTVLLSKRKKSS